LSQQRAGDVAAARATYQDAAQDLQHQLEKAAPDSFAAGLTHAFLGCAYAGLGEAASAIAEGQKAMALHSTSKDPVEGPDEEDTMASIYALLGDADHAIPILKRLLQIPYAHPITPALLRLNPIWDQIRNDPRFQKLCEEKPKWMPRRRSLPPRWSSSDYEQIAILKLDPMLDPLRGDPHFEKIVASLAPKAGDK